MKAKRAPGRPHEICDTMIESVDDNKDYLYRWQFLVRDSGPTLRLRYPVKKRAEVFDAFDQYVVLSPRNGFAFRI